MILAPYDDELAFRVFEMLDPYDLQEARIMRGARASHLQLFAEWRNAAQASVRAYVLRDAERPGHPPFAVLNLGHTGNYGVAQAALLARNHRRFRRALVVAGRMIREHMPAEAAEMGIRRIEARSWAGHPTAGTFLKSCGFRCEARAMPGFGAAGSETCQLFAWTI